MKEKVSAGIPNFSLITCVAAARLLMLSALAKRALPVAISMVVV